MRRSHRARASRARRPALPAVEPLEGRALLSHGAHGLPRSVGPAALVGRMAPAPHAARPTPVFCPTPAHLAARPAPAVAAPGVTVRPAGVVAPVPGPYTPAQVRHAYGFDRLGLDGAGQTIAIISAYDAPTIGNDLLAFDRLFGLPDAPFFKSVPKTGAPAFDPTWATESAMDVEWAHAVAPRATIVLVEAASAGYGDLLSAVDYAVGLGATVVSMSWGGAAVAGVSALDGHFNRPGVTFVAATGDAGGAGGAFWPAVSPYVTAVGGTTLALDAAGNRVAESAWAGGGGGTTPYVPRPVYQPSAYVGSVRGVPDVAFGADPGTGFYVVSTPAGGLTRAGGTSAGAPQWAGLFALANQGRAMYRKSPLGGAANAVLYRLAGGGAYTNPRGDFVDVTAGGNGYPASPGWDRATGLGAPAADRLVVDLIGA